MLEDLIVMGFVLYDFVV